MQAVLPGRPQSSRQAIATAHWDNLRLVAYISGNTVIVATGPRNLLQTIYIDVDTATIETKNAAGTNETDETENERDGNGKGELVAVAVEETSGKIAVCGKRQVWVYKPVGREEGVLSWVQGYRLALDVVGEQVEEGVLATSLSWASPEELMVGGSRMLLWYLDNEEGRIVWQQDVPYPTATAYFSHDGALLASTGQHDRIVKVWRRLSYEVDSTRFDVSYLAHPAAVTNLHWRKPWHSEMNLDNLLYTFCADNRIRVWVYSDPHSVSMMQMIAELDMAATIQPRRLSVGSMSRRRYGFIVDSRDFSNATEKAVLNAMPGQTDHALEHLIEVANRSPEICVVLDGLGHMSVWGLENAGCRNKSLTEVFNVAHVDDVNIKIVQGAPKMSDYTQFCVFANEDDSLSLLVHSFDGTIEWYNAKIAKLFDTAPRRERVRQIASWGGHHHSVMGLVRNDEGDLICSWSEREVVAWRLSAGRVLQKVFAVTCKHVIDVFFLEDELRVLDNRTLRRYRELRDDKVRDKAQKSSELGEKNLAEPKVLLNCDAVTAVLDEQGKIMVARSGNTLSNPCASASIAPCRTSGWLVAVAIEPDGQLHGLRCLKGELSYASSSIATNVEQADLLQGHASGKAAFTDRSRHDVSIWDVRSGVYELEKSFHDTVEELTWQMMENGCLVLAITFAFHIVLLRQAKYTLFQEDQDPWVRFGSIRIRQFTGHPIGAVCCLNDGSVVLGAGNQLFVLDATADEQRKGSPGTLANAQLPLYHPEILNVMLAQGDFHVVSQILQSLHEKLKYFTNGDQLSSMFDHAVQAALGLPVQAQPNGIHGVNGVHTNGQTILSGFADRLKDNIRQHKVSYLTIKARTRLHETVDVVLELEKQQSSLDGNALRYLHALYHTGTDAELPWSAIAFASLSTSQDPLVDLTTRFYGGKLTWQAARNSGMFLWLTDIEALKIQMENVGRAQYTQHEDRNPVDCSLYYLALGKKSVLQGLWRTSIGNREREHTMKILANNFNEPRWRSTALKNAYALLSKRRFEYAAAWFLLGGSLKDAVNVCVGQLQDLKLAVAIARVYDSPDTADVLRMAIEKAVFPAAVESDQGRWMAAWAYRFLDQPAKAVQALVRPVHEVTETDLSDFDGAPRSSYWKANDPLLTVLYIQLRESLISKNVWRNILKPGEERDFVLRCARYYARMGADVLALRLLKDWKFVEESKEAVARRGSIIDDTQQATTTQDAMSDEKEQSQQQKQKKPPPQFVEPSADSLLDSFGF